jgi:hypothetical protein
MYLHKTDEITSVEDIVSLVIGYAQSVSLAEYRVLKFLDLTATETNAPTA